MGQDGDMAPCVYYSRFRAVEQQLRMGLTLQGQVWQNGLVRSDRICDLQWLIGNGRQVNSSLLTNDIWPASRENMICVHSQVEEL